MLTATIYGLTGLAAFAAGMPLLGGVCMLAQLTWTVLGMIDLNDDDE